MRKTNIQYIEYLPLIIISMISFFLLRYIIGIFPTLVNIIEPLLWAFAIAYLINPIVKFFSKRLKLSWNVSVLITYILLAGIITLVFLILVPAIYDNITDLVNKLPPLIDKHGDEIVQYAEDLLSSPVLGENINVENVSSAIDKITTVAADVIQAISKYIYRITYGILRFIIGVALSIYMIKDKKSFKASFKKMILVRFDGSANEIFNFFRRSDSTFEKYLIGKFLDSLVIGVLAYIGFELMNAPYSPLLAIIIGATNMIPYFGPFIGAVPATLIVAFVMPSKALWVLLFIFLLQQADGYVIGPKILGESVGISPIWIIIAIILGGGLFGVIGMLIGVPVVAIIRKELVAYLDRRAAEMNIEV